MIKKIDPKNLTFIDEKEVPVRIRGTPWEEIFRSIPKGKVLVLQPDQVRSDTVRTALKRLQKKGKFRRLYMTTKKIGELKYVSYVVNPSELFKNEQLEL